MLIPIAQSGLPPGVDWTQTGVLAGLVIYVVYAGFKRKWLFHWAHEEIVRDLRVQLVAKTKESDEWKHMALRQAGILEKTVDRTSEVVQRTVTALEETTTDTG